LNVCMLTSDYLPNIGGIAAHVVELSRKLSQLGHNVWVINLSASPQTKAELKQREQQDDVSVWDLLHPNAAFPPLVARIVMAWRCATLVEDFIEANEVEILHWHTIEPAGLIAMYTSSNRIVRVFTNHSSGFLQNIDSPTKRMLYRIYLGHADEVICPSRELADKSRLIGFHPTHIHYIPNGVDTKKFFPRPKDTALLASLNAPPDDLVVACPRRLVWKTGVNYLLDAIPHVVASLTNVSFIIVGDGPEHKALLVQARGLGIEKHVRFVGRVANDTMPAIYNLADLVVLPSLIEATSIAGLEAMASGCPIVGTAVGGIPELVIPEENGLLVPPANSDELASALLHALRDEGARLHWGRAAREKAVTEFDWTIIAKRTIGVYKNAYATRLRRR